MESDEAQDVVFPLSKPSSRRRTGIDEDIMQRVRMIRNSFKAGLGGTQPIDIERKRATLLSKVSKDKDKYSTRQRDEAMGDVVTGSAVTSTRKHKPATTNTAAADTATTTIAKSLKVGATRPPLSPIAPNAIGAVVDPVTMVSIADSFVTACVSNALPVARQQTLMLRASSSLGSVAEDDDHTIVFDDNRTHSTSTDNPIDLVRCASAELDITSSTDNADADTDDLLQHDASSTSVTIPSVVVMRRRTGIDSNALTRIQAIRESFSDADRINGKNSSPPTASTAIKPTVSIAASTTATAISTTSNTPNNPTATTTSRSAPTLPTTPPQSPSVFAMSPEKRKLIRALTVRVKDVVDPNANGDTSPNATMPVVSDVPPASFPPPMLVSQKSNIVLTIDNADTTTTDTDVAATATTIASEDKHTATTATTAHCPTTHTTRVLRATHMCRADRHGIHRNRFTHVCGRYA
eukprot:m.205689 g.205689  ORF g.205689 m.205689 type:complete len:465 (-) comp32921_c1_seq1:505-1899(-)